jgi:hypothetical protein
VHTLVSGIILIIYAYGKKIRRPNNLKVFWKHSSISNEEQRPECILSDSFYTIKHILVDCMGVHDIRRYLISVN